MLNALASARTKSRLIPLLLLLTSVAWAVPARAQTVAYSNLSTSAANPTQTYTEILSLGQSFIPSASGLISSLALNLQTISPNVRPVYRVQLWSDSGGPTSLPTTLLATLITQRQWNLDRVSPPDASHLVTFLSSEFSANYSLISGATYWLVVASTDGPNKSWGVSSTSGGPTAMFRLGASQWVPLSLSGALGAEVSVLSAIPEPGAYAALGGCAVLGYAVFARRRARRVVPSTKGQDAAG